MMDTISLLFFSWLDGDYNDGRLSNGGGLCRVISTPCFSWLHGKQTLLITVPVRKNYSSPTICSVLGNKKSSINDNGASDPARVLLERLFIQTQKLEKMASDSFMPIDSQSNIHLGTLETDLQAVLSALKKKEEDLEYAEKRVLSEQRKIDLATEELFWREHEIDHASFKQEKLEEELELANIKISSRVLEIDDLKVQIEEREKEIKDAHSKLILKEDEMNMMKTELSTKSGLLVVTESGLEQKAKLLKEACEIVKKQEMEIQQLREGIQKREDDLKISTSLRELEEEKLKATEIKLEKRTIEWLIAQDELKKLENEANKRIVEVNKSAEEFQRVKKLLNDVKSELFMSQKALSSSRQKMEVHGSILDKQFMELEEEKISLFSYMTNLKDAQVEVESERVMLRVAEARNGELEQDLLAEKELISQLQAELEREKCSLKREIREKSFLEEKLELERTKLGEAQSLLQAKDIELVEARVEIQRLKSDYNSLKFILEERDSELRDAKIKLEILNNEIIELKTLMSSREGQLVQKENMLKDKEEHVQTMQVELNDMMLRSSEAETVVKRILELTEKMVNSIDNDNSVPINLLEDISGESMWEKKHFKKELKVARESLGIKEVETVDIQRALSMKDVELKRVHDRLEEREREIKEMKDGMTQDANDLRQLYALASERIEERSMSDLAIEKLQIEAAQLEAEAATIALCKLTEMSRDLISKANLSSDFDANIEGDNEGLIMFKTEVSRLSALTEQLVKEAGFVD